MEMIEVDIAQVDCESAPAGETTVSGAYRHTLHVEHPVEAVRAAGGPAIRWQLTVAHHDLVLMLHFGLSVYVDVLPDELPHLRPSEPLEEDLWLLILQRSLNLSTEQIRSDITIRALQLSV